MRLIIHATNISQGGGRSLLSALLESLPGDVEILAQLDKRMKLPADIPTNLEVRFVEPSILQRFLAEWWLWKIVRSSDLVICFGSLPPATKLSGYTSVFIQNRYLIEKNSLASFSLKTRLRLYFERAYLALTASNADEFIVQSPAMQRTLLSSGISKNRSIHIRPFIASSEGYQRVNHAKAPENITKDYDFIYIASGEPHKNHRKLVEAWCLLANESIFPTLCLTINKRASVELCAWIDEKKNDHSLKLLNVGSLPHNQTLELYSQARALIYPSRFESFGLPLIEACQANLPVLASELDYVRDVLDPVQTFNPDSPVSIARAVKRYLALEEPALPLMDATFFLRMLFKQSR
jgi:glycosyltransferase involved in cell wall biosynthesis